MVGWREDAAAVLEWLLETPSKGGEDPPVVVMLREGVVSASVMGVGGADVVWI